MTITISSVVRFARLASLTNEFDGGTLEFWSGARPAGGTTPAGVLQATASLPTPAGAVDSSFLFTFATIGDALRVAAATIVWARFKSSSGGYVCDVDVALAATPGVPPAEILLGNTSGAIGAFLHVVGGTIQG